MRSHAEFARALDTLESEGAVWPHGVRPMTRAVQHPGEAGGHVETVEDRFPRTAAEWDAYPYNPPGDMAAIPEFRAVDPDATAKPTYAALRAAQARATADGRDDALLRLSDECRRRISAAYGASDWADEIERRLAARHTAAQDAERDRLRTRHAAVKAWILDPARTAPELAAFDPTDAAHWAAPPV